MQTMLRSFRLLLLFTAMLALCCAGCRDEDDNTPKAKFTLTIKAQYDGQTLKKGQTYSFGDDQIRFEQFSTYLSDIALLKDGKETRISEIEWVEFTNTDAQNQDATLTFTYDAPIGAYTGLKIGYGVKPDLNKKRPSDFPVGHPLYQENEYWLGWKSYIFTKITGYATIDGVANNDLTYHCGSDVVYNTAEFAQDVAVDGASGLTLTFDLKKALTFDGALLDIAKPENQKTSHVATNVELGKKIMFNLKNATQLQR